MIFSFRFCLIALAVVLQTGCASNQIHYYSLMPVGQVGEASATPVVPAPFLFEILPVGMPTQVDRQELVVRQGSGFLILDGERWAAPLSDEMREALSMQLQSRLGAQDVSGLVHPAGSPVLRVKLMVRQFESVPGQYVQVDADWNLSRTDKSDVPRLLCHSHFRTAVSEDSAGLVLAHQSVVAALSRQIAGTARTWMASGGNACMRENLATHFVAH
jgi:uncharacterized protein